MLVFLFVVATASIALPVTNAASNCSLCELGGSFVEMNRYACVPLSSGHVACICPDGRYKLDARCRICERNGICGDNLNNDCSEESFSSLGSQNNSTNYFACFCTDETFVVGKACPSTATTTTTTTTLPSVQSTATNSIR